MLVVYSVHVSCNPGAHRAACVMLFWFLLSFPHERLNVTDTSCTLWVSSCNITLPSAHIGTLVWVFPWEKPKMAGSTVRPDHVSKYIPADLCSSFFLSSNAVGGTTTQTGLGTCTSIVHMRTPAWSAVLCLIPAVLLSLERCVLFLGQVLTN